MADRYRIGDGELHTVVRGRGAPLVLLHGFPLSHRMWDAQIDLLAEDRRVIAPDQRGFGKSSLGSRPLTMAQFADDLAALLDALAVRDPVVVCGLSMGGYVALQFQRAHAGRVRALILCDTRATADTPAAAADRHALAERVGASGPAAVVDAMLPKLLAPITFDQQPHVVERMREMMLATSPDTIIAALHALATRPDQTAHLASIDVPALAIVGEHDALTTPETMRAMADAIPRCHYAVIPSAGHMSPMEYPAGFNAAVQEFLAQLR